MMPPHDNKFEIQSCENRWLHYLGEVMRPVWILLLGDLLYTFNHMTTPEQGP